MQALIVVESIFRDMHASVVPKTFIERHRPGRPPMSKEASWPR